MNASVPFVDYQGVRCISGGWIIANNIVSKTNLQTLVRRKIFMRIRRGGRGRSSLIVWDSMPDKYKQRIIKSTGEQGVVPQEDPDKFYSMIMEICKVSDDLLRISLMQQFLSIFYPKAKQL